MLLMCIVYMSLYVFLAPWRPGCRGEGRFGGTTCLTLLV